LGEKGQRPRTLLIAGADGARQSTHPWHGICLYIMIEMRIAWYRKAYSGYHCENCILRLLPKAIVLISALSIIMLTQVSVKAEDIFQVSKPYGGTLSWGTRNKPTIINPILTTHSISATLEELIFNRLVRINSKGEIWPDLAESWDISSDGLEYTFHLRKGIKFHDGVECTADDIKFTYDKLIDPEVNSPFKSSFELVDRFEVIDRYTFQIILKEPSVSFLYRLVREIAPRHLLEEAELKNCPFNFHPIGTGPFRFKQWTEDNQIILEYNPDYYEGRPYLDKIIVKAYPDSKDVWTALMRGEVDYVEFIEREDYEIAKEDSSFKAYAFAIDIYYAISYDLNNPMLADKKLREAIAYGIDRKSLIERAAFGYGLECNGPFYPQSLGFNPDALPFEYNPQRSQELLAEAGWQDGDNDGILEKEGEELELKVLVDARSKIYKRIIMVLRQQLQEIGIKIKVQLYNDQNILAEEFLKHNKPQAQLKLFLAGYPHETREDWSSKETKRRTKLCIYKNEEADRLFALGEVTPDKEKRSKIYQEIHKIIHEDQPACFLFFPFDFQVVSAKFEGVDEFFTLSMPYYTIKDWYLGTQMRVSEKGGEQRWR